jgi:2'-5' RNA ligase
MPRRRLGVALLVPQPVATEVDGLRRALGDGARARIPAHLTLVPPVNVAADALPDAVEVLRAAARATRPFGLRLGPATTFAPVTPVVYLAVDGDVDALRTLRDRVFVAPLSRPLTRPFVPHVTVADDMDPARIPAATAALADFVVDVQVEAVHLLEEGGGRVWQPIAEAPFSRRRLPG